MHSDEFIDFQAISPVRLTMDGDFRYIFGFFFNYIIIIRPSLLLAENSGRIKKNQATTLNECKRAIIFLK